MRVNMHEAKTSLSKLVAAIEAGEVEEIEVARNGHVVARLVPPRQLEPRRPGALAGKIRIGEDFDDPLPPDIARAFGMEE